MIFCEDLLSSSLGTFQKIILNFRQSCLHPFPHHVILFPESLLLVFFHFLRHLFDLVNYVFRFLFATLVEVEAATFQISQRQFKLFLMRSSRFLNELECVHDLAEATLAPTTA